MINKKLKSFTFIELLLYIGLVSIFLIALASFIGFFTQAKTKSSTIEEVNQQGLYISEYIGQLIRDSNTITTPAKTQTLTALTLASTKFPARSPIVISLSSGKITVNEAGATAVQISSNLVTISSLSFTNLSQTSTNGTIRYAFTVVYNNASGKSEFNYTQNFYGSASTR